MTDPRNLIPLGGDTQSGSYVLRLRVTEPLSMAFGRFRKAKIIDLPRGEYVYIGSALATKGGVSLARRLVRHATRTDPANPHPIRADMLRFFPTIGLGHGDLLPKNGKTLFWNVDHLLDQPTVRFEAAYFIRSIVRMERELGQLLEEDVGTRIIEKGLGANDVPGNTHILLVEGDRLWWEDLPRKLNVLL